MDRRVKEFRRVAANVVGAGTGRRYSARARALAVEFARESVSKGDSVMGAAMALGVAAQTLAYWLSRAQLSTRAALVPVEVIGTRASVAASGDGVVVALPNGIVVSGLDADGAVVVLRGLR